MLLAVRAFAVWLLLITAEVIHGIVRTLLLTPVVGDLRARQLGVLTGSLLIVLITALTIRWIRASRRRTLLMIGGTWVVLTVAFEIGLGRMMGYSWERLGSDYNLIEGGLLPIGFVIMATSPLIAAHLRIGSCIVRRKRPSTGQKPPNWNKTKHTTERPMTVSPSFVRNGCTSSVGLPAARRRHRHGPDASRTA